MKSEAREKSNLSKIIEKLKFGKYHEAKQIFHSLDIEEKTLDGKEKLKYYFIRTILTLRHGSYDEAMDLVSQLIELSKSQGNHYYETHALILKSEILDRLAKFKRANLVIENAKSSIERLDEASKAELIPKLQTIEGFILMDTGRLNDAITTLENNIPKFANVDNKLGIAICYNAIGLCHRLKGQLVSSLTNYKTALSQLRKIGSKYYESLLLNNIGVIYRLRGEPENALEYFLDSLELREEFESMHRVAGVLENIGITYFQKSEYEAAYRYLLDSLEMMEDVGNEQDISYTLYYLLRVILTLEDEENFVNHFDQLEKLHKQNESKYITLRYKLIKALKLKEANSIQSVAKAQRILQQIISDKIIIHELTIVAMISLCEIYLLEIRMFEDFDKISQVENLVERLVSNAREENSFVTLVHSLILQARLFLYKREFEEVLASLKQARLITEERGLENLGELVDKEETFLEKEFRKYEELKYKSEDVFQQFNNEKIIEYLGEIKRFI